MVIPYLSDGGTVNTNRKNYFRDHSTTSFVKLTDKTLKICIKSDQNLLLLDVTYSCSKLETFRIILESLHGSISIKITVGNFSFLSPDFMKSI